MGPAHRPAVLEPGDAGLDGGDPGALDDHRARRADGPRQPVDEPARVHARAVRVVRRAAGPARVEALAGGGLVEPGGPEAPRLGVPDLGPGAGDLGVRPGQRHGAALAESAVDAERFRRPPHLVDGVPQRGEQLQGGPAAVAGRDGVGPDRPQGRHPAAVAAAGPEADVLGLEDDDLRRRPRPEQVVGGPQPGEAAADDDDVGGGGDDDRAAAGAGRRRGAASRPRCRSPRCRSLRCQRRRCPTTAECPPRVRGAARRP